MSNEFSVCIFFEDGSYSYEQRYVPLERAMTSAQHHSASVGAKLGMTKRVIITDGGDSIVYEWKFGEGIVWPTKEEIEKAKKADE